MFYLYHPVSYLKLFVFILVVVFKATIFMLVAPNETDTCLITYNKTTIEEELAKTREILERNPEYTHERYKFIRYPSVEAIKILDGTLKSHNPLVRILELICDMTPQDYHIPGNGWSMSLDALGDTTTTTLNDARLSGVN